MINVIKLFWRKSRNNKYSPKMKQQPANKQFLSVVLLIFTFLCRFRHPNKLCLFWGNLDFTQKCFIILTTGLCPVNKMSCWFAALWLVGKYWMANQSAPPHQDSIFLRGIFSLYYCALVCLASQWEQSN